MSNRFFIIGYGGMGKIRERIAKENGFQLGGILDAEKGFSAPISPESGDFVFICTPPHLHRGYCNEFSGKGIKVFCEKPFVRGDVFTGWSHRYHPVISELREKNYLFVEIEWVRSKGIPAGWMSDGLELYGHRNDAWGDIGVHLADMACFISRADGKITSKFDFDFSQGDIGYKADWWGEGDWKYKTNDNSVVTMTVGKTLYLLRVAWASPEEEHLTFKGYSTDKELIEANINPMEDIFERETADFLKGKEQEVYHVFRSN